MIVNGERRETKKMKRTIYSARRDRESEEERQTRLERHGEYERCRYAAMNTKQWRNLKEDGMAWQ